MKTRETTVEFVVQVHGSRWWELNGFNNPIDGKVILRRFRRENPGAEYRLIKRTVIEEVIEPR